jgi:hypothetical protein
VPLVFPLVVYFSLPTDASGECSVGDVIRTGRCMDSIKVN